MVDDWDYYFIIYKIGNKGSNLNMKFWIKFFGGFVRVRIVAFLKRLLIEGRDWLSIMK